MKQVLYVLIGVVAGFLMAAVLLLVARLPAGQAVTLEPAPTKEQLMVQVSGAVVRPGVYSFPDGSRVQDAVDAAGGLLAEANTDGINMAERLQDAQEVNIPYVAGAGPASSSSSASNNPSPFTVITSSPTPDLGQTELVDINSASLQELDSLPGIGPTTAQNIIDYREQHGPFNHIEDIMNVPGIGPATFDRISSLITVGP